MPEYQWKFSCIFRNLKKNIGMITMEGLSCGIRPGRIVCTLLDRIKGSRGCNNFSAYGKTPLFFNDYRRGLSAVVSFCCYAGVKAQTDKNQYKKNINFLNSEVIVFPII
ncbi:MAG: hypothetical protein RBR08_07630 [Desulforegulaceae bacterium]|nr:hypothetical protein [Desulforegulaceae bacterium]